MEVEFRNVTITIGNVRDARQAYDQLCDVLGGPTNPCIEFTTDTFVVYEDNRTADKQAEEHDTAELFPE